MPKYKVGIPLVSYAFIVEEGESAEAVLERVYAESQKDEGFFETKIATAETTIESVYEPTERTPWAIKPFMAMLFARAFRQSEQREGVYWIVQKFRG